MNHNAQEPNSPTIVGPLLTKAKFCELLAISERKFDELLSSGVIDPPLDLGPRAGRWTHEDYAAAVTRLPRRNRQAEPETLSAGRRRRIEGLKAGGAR
jgi:predicted DNA-binding transcriptional regulator AlpA